MRRVGGLRLVSKQTRRLRVEMSPGGMENTLLARLVKPLMLKGITA